MSSKNLGKQHSGAECPKPTLLGTMLTAGSWCRTSKGFPLSMGRLWMDGQHSPAMLLHRMSCSWNSPLISLGKSLIPSLALALLSLSLLSSNSDSMSKVSHLFPFPPGVPGIKHLELRLLISLAVSLVKNQIIIVILSSVRSQREFGF